MEHRPDHLETGRQLLELQLAMMKGAMTFMAGSAQRMAEIGFGVAAAASAARRPAAQRPAAGVPDAVQELTRAASANAARVAATRRHYALRVQQDVDSILHAFAMVPDAADRLIRASALLTERPGTGAQQRTQAPARRAPAGRAARRATGEHAR